MAQFSHPELGGMGQWSMGGMIMVGDMFNNGLKARVDALCNDLSALLRGPSPFAAQPGGRGGACRAFGALGSCGRIGRWPRCGVGEPLFRHAHPF
jgi:hypothetical protein